MAYPNKTLQNPQSGQRIRFVRTSRETGGQVLELESTFAPHSKEPVAHYHPQQDEDFRVLRGELTVRLDGRVQVFGPGATLRISRNRVHSMWNNGSEEAVVTWIVQPALSTEAFFETTMGLAADGKTGANGMPSLWQVALLANRFSPVFRLAKPPFWVQRLVFTLLTPLSYLLGYRATYRQYLD